MGKSWLLPLALIALITTCAAASPPPIPAGSTQMLLVKTANWGAIAGTLQRYERTASGWQAVGASWPVVLGRAGLGWGRGLAAAPPDVPDKREGDGRSPAGVYYLGDAYGYSAAPPTGTQLPYRSLDRRDRCVDDVQAQEYNRIVTIGVERPETWKSAETMRRTDELYRWVVFVAHNSDPPVAGGGSCIFLHVWHDPSSPTAGCTAMARDNLETLLAWLKPEARPVLVQLPEISYAGLHRVWELP